MIIVKVNFGSRQNVLNWVVQLNGREFTVNVGYWNVVESLC